MSQMKCSYLDGDYKLFIPFLFYGLLATFISFPAKRPPLIICRHCSGWTSFRLRAAAIGHASARGGCRGSARQAPLQERVNGRRVRVLRDLPRGANPAAGDAFGERGERKQLVWRMPDASVGSEEVQFAKHRFWTSQSLLSWADQVKTHHSLLSIHI